MYSNTRNRQKSTDEPPTDPNPIPRAPLVCREQTGRYWRNDRVLMECDDREVAQFTGAFLTVDSEDLEALEDWR